MKASILYADLTEWSGSIEELVTTPDEGIINIRVYHPTPEYSVCFSGWDHYAVRNGTDIGVSIWKDDDAADRDGTPDPYRGQGMAWIFYSDGRQEYTDYLPKDEIDQTGVVRHGLWIDDDIARSIGLL